MLAEIRTKPVETLVFRSAAVALGRFVCPSSHPLFRDSGPCSYHTIVFPRTVTKIQLADGRRFVGDPTSVVFYNQNQEYTRTRVSETDACDWFVVADDLLLDAIEPWDRSVRDRADRPFRVASAPIAAGVYLEQRRVFHRALRSGADDRLAIEEAVLFVLSAAIRSAHESPDARKPRREQRLSPDRIDAVKRAIASTPAHEIGLLDLARLAGCSRFQLCRSFRRATGDTMTGYRHSLRMREALGLLREGRRDLTELALDLGYSSHSHFSAVFRRTFGMPPSAWRAIA